MSRAPCEMKTLHRRGIFLGSTDLCAFEYEQA